MEILDFSRIDGLTHEYQRRVAKVIKDMYPTVRLLRLEPGHPQFNPEKPYALVDEPELLPPYVIRTLHESQIDARLIAELAMGDNQNPDATVNKWEILAQAEQALQMKSELEYYEERKDLLKSMVKSNKHEYKHDGHILRK
jgi:hypothetical protein